MIEDSAQAIIYQWGGWVFAGIFILVIAWGFWYANKEIENDKKF